MPKAAMSNPNALLGQKSCCYLNQGLTYNDIKDRRLNDVLISDQTNWTEANVLKAFES